ncbi:MAG: hydrolase 1, exosortase A system-associated, partial [Sphingomonadaceae bacterium]|nr:hydrolase 1, exosortase A system-associated [Sphingomonadaceae bacterium]
MHRLLTFDCQGATLAGVLHPATGTTGVLIVSGGAQTRAGSHRSFVALADRLAAAGYPAFRFDRRGVGDSDGEDRGFRDSADDIASAIAEFREQIPDLKQVIGWGLCDGASSLALNADALGLEGLILANPWTRDADAPVDLPPRAAVAARYRQRLTSPSEWVRLARRGFDVRKAARGLLRMALPEAVPLTARSV